MEVKVGGGKPTDQRVVGSGRVAPVKDQQGCPRQLVGRHQMGAAQIDVQIQIAKEGLSFCNGVS
ncbi:hypothetical protein HMPREF0262_01405 [Clostridium sp. ATCC 29733]|nr:hypothetical protein HMPREF0262_01405 [Clostridium sp. ATCC 29733]